MLMSNFYSILDHSLVNILVYLLLIGGKSGGLVRACASDDVGVGSQHHNRHNQSTSMFLEQHPGHHLHDSNYRNHQHQHRGHGGGRHRKHPDQHPFNGQTDSGYRLPEGSDGTREYEWNIDDWWHQNIREDIRSYRAAAFPVSGRNMDRSSDPDFTDRLILSYSSPSLSSVPNTRLSLMKPPILFNPRLRSMPSVISKSENLQTADSTPVLTYTEPDIAELARSANVSGLMSSHLPLVSLSNPKWPILSQSKVTPFIPTSSLQSIKSLFYDYFSTIRNGEHNNFQYITIKRNLRQRFTDLGLQTMTQGFYPSQQSGGTKIRGHNIVGVYPGIYRNSSDPGSKGKDSVLVIGAHFDTVKRSPGVDDNGSGSATVLELARLLQQHKCALNTTIIFVLFDMEESGLHGSKHFVKNYLFPVEIEKRKNPIKGAIIMDMMLEYDNSINSQSVTELNRALPDWDRKMRLNQNRGDFLAVWARRDIDNQLFNTLEQNWINRSKYKLFLLDPPLPELGRQLTLGLQNHKLRPYRTFLRSDHSSFWYPHSLKDQTIVNTILLNDMGPWRRRVSNRYHNSQDNTQLLTRDNLLFLKNSIDSMVRTILVLSDGRCQSVPPT